MQESWRYIRSHSTYEKPCMLQCMLCTFSDTLLPSNISGACIRMYTHHKLIVIWSMGAHYLAEKCTTPLRGLAMYAGVPALAFLVDTNVLHIHTGNRIRCTAVKHVQEASM